MSIVELWTFWVANKAMMPTPNIDNKLIKKLTTEYTFTACIPILTESVASY